jgi:hypothetical protein
LNLYEPYGNDPIDMSDTSGLAPSQQSQDMTFLDAWSHAPLNDFFSPKSKFFIPWAVGRSVFYELPPLVVHTIGSAFSEFRADMGTEAAKTQNIGGKTVFNTFKYGSYGVEALAQGTYSYAQFESSGVGGGVRWITTAPRIARYARPLITYGVYGLTAGKAVSVGSQIYSGDTDNLSVNDFVDLGFGAYGSYHLAGGRNGFLDPRNYNFFSPNGVSVTGQVTFGANRWLPFQYAPPAVDLPSAYSVAFEYQLAQDELGLSRPEHNQIANDALREERSLNTMLAKLVPPPNGWGRPPADWTWQHATIRQANGRIGVLQLVPRGQHTSGSPFWLLLHPLPGGRGGYAEWAIPAGAPKN